MQSLAKLTLLGSTITLLVASSGCSSSKGAGSVSVSSHPASNVVGGSFVVGHVLATSDPNQLNVNKGMQQEASKLGFKVKFIDALDASHTNDAMKTLINEHVNALVVEVISIDALGAGLQAAKDAHIPVILSLGAGTPAPPIIAISNEDAGAVSTQSLISQNGPDASILAFTFPPGQPCVVNGAGFDSVVKNYPGLKVQKEIVPNTNILQFASNATAAWLERHPAGSGKLAIWGCWDGPILGATVALRQAHRTDVKTYGIFVSAFK